MRYLYLILIFLTFVSCQRETEIDIPQSDPKIALSCFLIPQKNIEIYLCQSIYIYDTEEVPITNAIVKLYKNNSLLEVIPHSEKGYYRTNKQPEAGANYSIEVVVDGFEAIKAKTTIPKPSIISSTILQKNTTTDNGSSLIFYQMTIKAPDTNSVKYYDYFCNIISDKKHFDGTPNYFSTAISYDTFIMNEGDEKTSFFSIDLFNNSTFKLNLYYNDPHNYLMFEDTVSYNISSQIYSISKELYLYKKSLRKYSTNHANIWQFSNPSIYSNIENGYGIFAGLSFSDIVTEHVD